MASKPTSTPRWNRIVLKLSGEALAESTGFGLDNDVLHQVATELHEARQEFGVDIAVHVAFARPKYMAKSDVPQEVIDAERATLEVVTRNEGKPEAAIGKIVEGRVQGFFKDIALLEQPYAKDDKQSVAQIIGKSTIVRYSQVEIG